MRLWKSSLTVARGPPFEVLMFSHISPNLPPYNLHLLILILLRQRQVTWQPFKELEAAARTSKGSLLLQGVTATSTYLFSNDPDTWPLSLRTKLLLIFSWLMLSSCHLKPHISLK